MGRAWLARATAGSPPDDLAEQRAALGLPYSPPEPPEPIEIEPDMEPAVSLFAVLATQWRVGPGGGLTGLDYAAARAACDFLGLTPSPGLLADLRQLEAGVLAALAERG